MARASESIIEGPDIDNEAMQPRHIDQSRNFAFGEKAAGLGLVLPVKTTAGDPSSPSEGQIYVNTADNAVRVFADSAWRDLATWV